MKVFEVMHCSFSAWYPKFKNVSIKSITLPIPQDFLEYLHADGVVLPDSNTTVDENDPNEDNVEGEELDVNWDSEDPGAETPNFPEFDSAVKRSIKSLGGLVFPKLNWSAPRDATWIAFDKTLKCTCPCDIYLLLKSSEFVTHDLTEPFIHCEDYEEEKDNVSINYQLVLRKWQNLNPGYEFRCFVRDNKLIAISQRCHTSYYEFIKKEKEDIVSDIQAFFYHIIYLKFPNQSYVFDVYRRDQGKLLLIDFNPFGTVTDSLLFNWEELLENETLTGTDPEDSQVPAFRYVEASSGVQPNPLSSFGIPRDFLDLATGSDPHKLMDLLQLKQNQQESSSEEEDENRDVT